MAKSRNQLLNIVEAIATFLVVFIHFPFPGRAGAIVTALARISVPFFFCISGFFFYKDDEKTEKHSVLRKIKRLLLLMVFSEVSYYLFYVALQIQNTGFSTQAFVTAATAELNAFYLPQFIDYVVVFAPPFNGVLWFVGSLIVIYVVVHFIPRRHRSVLMIAVVLLLAGILLRRILFYSQVNTTFPYERLLPVLPFPFFIVGYHIRKNQNYFNGVKDHVYAISMIGGIAITVLESFAGVHTLYFGTMLIVCTVIPWCAKHDDYTVNSIFGRIFSHIGGRTATYIYVFHMMIGNILHVIVPRILSIDESSAIYKWGIPIMICIASACGAEVIYVIKERFLLKRR